MAENENSKGLRGMLQGAAGAVAKKAQEIKIPEIKLPEIKLPDIKITNPFQKKAEKEETPQPVRKIISISVKSAIKIIYYMMAVDGTIYQDEEDKFDEIGKELDPDFQHNKDEIIRECQAQEGKLIDPEDHYAVLQEGVEEAIAIGVITKGAVIAPKILVWDLLAVAYSDGNYDENERKLLKYVVRKLDISKDVFLEMESSYLALLDLESFLAWIKTTDRPYLVIEKMVNEINDRKTVIMESVKDLIAY